MKNNRLFGILYLLLSKEKITSKELAEYFEVSTRTIYRDIEVLCELQIPICMSKGKNGGIHLLENFKLDKSLLTEEEQKDILFSLNQMNTLKIENDKTYEKMKNLFQNEEDSWFEVDFSVWGNSKEHKENFEKIKGAILEQKKLQFSYFNSYGTYTNREVEPMKLHFKYNSWYLEAFDLTKEDYRIFKILRMKDLIVLEETFEKRKIEKKKELNPENFKVVQLVLQIDKSQSYRVYDEFEEKNIKKTEDGNFLVTVEYPFTDWVYGYILSFGSSLKVLEPGFIKEEIIKRLKKNLQNYEI